MNVLTCTYECKLDAKGRFMLPAGLKRDLASVLAEGFVIKHSMFEGCLEICTAQEWSRKLAVITKKINPFNRREAAFLRSYSAGARKVELDSVGRLLISKESMLHAGLGKEIVLTGTGLVIEIWDKSRYEEVISQEDIGDLAQELFGEKNIFDELS